MVNVYDPPLSVTDKWPRPNYINPESEGPGLVIVGIILATMGTSFVAIRLYARIFVTRALGIDDILIVLAVIFAIGMTSLNIVTNVRYGMGYHLWDIPPSDFVDHRLTSWTSLVFAIITKTFTKISVLLFYRRLSVSFTKRFLTAVWVGIIYNIVYCIGFLLAACLICNPLKAYWLKFDHAWTATHSYSCGKERTMVPLSVLLSAISDLYTAIIPMVLIFNLNLPTTQKRALYFLFSLAFLVVISGFIRVAYIYITLTVTYDYTWTLWKMWVVAQVEIWLAICVASAPALKPMVKRLCSAVEQSVSEIRQRRLPDQGTVDRYPEELKRLAVTKGEKLDF